MYNIMIVDDEKIERETIKFLIEEYKLPLIINEAVNGKAALEYIKSHEINILFTDIKMPFMDGIELTEKALELNPCIKVVMFSAYAEFEYARKAIDLSITHYLLKPVVVSEFLTVINKVISLCKECDEEKALRTQLDEKYKKVIAYEKERMLLDIFYGRSKVSEVLEDEANKENLDFLNKRIYLFFLDSNVKFFDNNNNSFKEFLQINIEYKCEYVNLNEYQSIIIIDTFGIEIEEFILTDLAKKLRKDIQKLYDLQICIVVSRLVEGIKGLHLELDKIEQALEFKFFFEDGIILFMQKDNIIPICPNNAIIKIQDNIIKYLNENDYINAEKGIWFLFSNIDGKELIPEYFLKYICLDIIKKIVEKVDKEKLQSFDMIVDDVFKCEILHKLKELIWSYFNEYKNQLVRKEDNICMIKKIINIIHINYMSDISLDWIAKKVYLSSGYLSSFFKRETGQSIVKYITSYRLEKAMEILKDPDLKISDVSKKVGYSNVSYFCMVFKNYFGESPEKYRKNDEKC